VRFAYPGYMQLCLAICRRPGEGRDPDPQRRNTHHRHSSESWNPSWSSRARRPEAWRCFMRQASG